MVECTVTQLQWATMTLQLPDHVTPTKKILLLDEQEVWNFFILAYMLHSSLCLVTATKSDGVNDSAVLGGKSPPAMVEARKML